MTAPLNVATHLARLATERPDGPAVHLPIGSVDPNGPSPHRTLTYAQLNATVDAYAAGLRSVGITSGTRVALMVPPGESFFALTFALLRLAAVPVLIDPGMGLRNLGKCLAEAEPEAFVGIPKAHLARRLLRWGRKSIRTTVNVGSRRFFCTACTREWKTSQSPPPAGGGPTVSADDPAAILFTSGSTGVAKGAEYTHGIFAAQVELLKAVYGIRPGETDFCTFPLFALFGPALGMACVVPDMNASRPATLDPRKALSQITQFGVTNLFGSPAVIRNLSTLPDGTGLGTLRRVISAGAPANVAVLERFTKLLPAGVQVFTPYGATEALPVANIGSDEILGETKALTEQGRGVCVGRPVPGVEVRVIRISDEPIAEWDEALVLPAGEVGEFVVRGPVVTKRYWNRNAATKLAKIVDAKTGDVLHRMGDVGYFDDQGRMWFCGRKSHRVEAKDGTLFTDMVEPVFNAAALVKRTALVGVRRGAVVQPVMCVELERAWGADTVREAFRYFLGGMRGLMLGPEAVWDIARSDLRSIAAKHYRRLRIKTFLWHRGSFPVDVRHNSKIFREKLAAWAAKKLK